MRSPSQGSDHKSGLRRWLGLIATAAGVLVLLLGLATWFAGREARVTLAQQHPAPGQMVDVGGYKMHLNCRGEGSPTVILDAGLRDFSVHWALVQPEVARFTRVCTYDRAGLGWSEPGALPRSSETMVKELHTLLANAQVAKPFLLVGHSFGGMNMRLYAATYPEEVVGMVLVDPMHAEQGIRLPAYQEANKEVDRQFRRLALLRGAGIVALFHEKIPKLGLPGVAAGQYAAILATTRYFQTAVAESQALAQSYAAAQAAGSRRLGDLPLIMISRGLAEPIPGLSVAENQQNEQVWQEMQAELVTLSQRSEHLVAEKSGHSIPLQQPELVIDAIRRLVLAPRTQVLARPPHLGLATSGPAPSPAEETPTVEITPPPAEPVQTDTRATRMFTLRTEFEAGRMLFVGVGGDIDGLVSPDLLVPPGTIVQITLVNGDGIAHDIYFPDFAAQSVPVNRKGERAEVSFTVKTGEARRYVYYCTFPGHRAAGQEGWLIVKGGTE